ncbi:hypothetical protein RHMOL_Rhmol01G0081200 [Rhododendron molle]|uniref:Uncharacterized protein n=1 Tax=Rhododendron molle TaxID=49168 RepID=A0ACC0Q120_RHOML|nr:hypothetical protein RHMOL_Rhmol01G0081200 [Rhododendron molle]
MVRNTIGVRSAAPPMTAGLSHIDNDLRRRYKPVRYASYFFSSLVFFFFFSGTCPIVFQRIPYGFRTRTVSCRHGYFAQSGESA